MAELRVVAVNFRARGKTFCCCICLMSHMNSPHQSTALSAPLPTERFKKTRLGPPYNPSWTQINYGPCTPENATVTTHLTSDYCLPSKVDANRGPQCPRFPSGHSATLGGCLTLLRFLIAEFYLVDRGLRHRLPGFSSLGRLVILPF